LKGGVLDGRMMPALYVEAAITSRRARVGSSLATSSAVITVEE